VFEVDYALTAARLCGAEWEVNLAAVLGAMLDMELPALQMTKPLELQWPWTSIVPLRTNNAAIWTSEKC
jgi:hypothetical protein